MGKKHKLEKHSHQKHSRKVVNVYLFDYTNFFHLNDDNKKRQIKWYFRPWYGTSLQNFVKIILKKSNHFVFQIAFHSWYKPCDFLQVFLENNNLATGVVSMTKGNRRRRRPGQCPNSSSKLDRIWLLSELMHPLYLQSTNQIVR